jgi:tryptophanyl-tRNA synthetase
MQTAQQGWEAVSSQTDKAKTITAKFKSPRKVLRSWQQNLSSLKRNLSNVKVILSLLEIIEECRDLTIMEQNFKETLIGKINQFLEQQRVY